ncbi:UNVERIFIED_ORG: hypothetical protein QE446_001578 [Rhizobium sp. SORGH_AS260]|nr:hypothetical protein [Rhizobium sp. SORGH_AS_0260]
MSAFLIDGRWSRVCGTVLAAGAEQEGEREQDDQPGHDQRGARPAGAVHQHQKQAGADGGAEIGAAYLCGVAPSMMLFRQRFDRIAVAGDVDCRRHQPDYRQDGDCDGNRRRAGESKNSEAAGAGGDARADDHSRPVPANGRQPVTLHMR